jgi:hypothetical protein
MGESHARSVRASTPRHQSAKILSIRSARNFSRAASPPLTSAIP